MINLVSPIQFHPTIKTTAFLFFILGSDVIRRMGPRSLRIPSAIHSTTSSNFRNMRLLVLNARRPTLLSVLFRPSSIRCAPLFRISFNPSLIDAPLDLWMGLPISSLRRVLLRGTEGTHHLPRGQQAYRGLRTEQSGSPRRQQESLKPFRRKSERSPCRFQAPTESSKSPGIL